MWERLFKGHVSVRTPWTLIIVLQFISASSRRSEIFNNLPLSLTSSDVDIFKSNPKTYLFQLYDHELDKLLS